MGCPNKSLKEYQVLVTEFGEGKALALWIKNGEEIPSIEKARQLLKPKSLSSQIEVNDDGFVVAVKAANGEHSILYASLSRLINDSTKETLEHADFNDPEAYNYQQYQSEYTEHDNPALQVWRAIHGDKFKSWFGDWENDPEHSSQVLDANDEPLLVYTNEPRFIEGKDSYGGEPATYKEYQGMRFSKRSKGFGEFMYVRGEGQEAQKITKEEYDNVNSVFNRSMQDEPKDYSKKEQEIDYLYRGLDRAEERGERGEYLNDIKDRIDGLKKEVEKESAKQEPSHYQDENASFVADSKFRPAVPTLFNSDIEDVSGKHNNSLLQDELRDNVFQKAFPNADQNFIYRLVYNTDPITGKIGMDWMSAKEKKEYFTKDDIIKDQVLSIIKEYKERLLHPLFLNIKNPLVTEERINDKLRYEAKSEGHDGIISDQSYSINAPNQVKSVRNVGEFSKSKDSIYAQQSSNSGPSDIALNNRIKGFIAATNGALREVDQIVVNGKVINANAITNVIDRTIEYVANKVKLDTLPEEAAHIYVQWLPANSLLLSDMIADIKNQEVYYTTYEQYKNNPLYQNEDGSVNEDKIAREAIGKMIAKVIVGEDKSRKNKSLLTRLLDWIKSVFTGRTFDSSYHQAATEILNADTSSLDMAAMKEANQKGEYYLQQTSVQDDYRKKLLKKANPIQQAIMNDRWVNPIHGVTLEEIEHRYWGNEVENPTEYRSTTKSIGGTKTFGKDPVTGKDEYEDNREWGKQFDGIMTDIVYGIEPRATPLLDKTVREDAIRFIHGLLAGLRLDGTIVIPQVIVANKQTGDTTVGPIGGSIDLECIHPDGSITQIDLKTSWDSIHSKEYTRKYPVGTDAILTGALSKATKQSVQVGIYRKLTRLDGYPNVKAITYHLHLGHDKKGMVTSFTDEGSIVHPDSENEALVDKIVPTVYQGKDRLEELGFGAPEPKEIPVDPSIQKKLDEALNDRISNDILPALNSHIEYLKELRRIGRINISENAIAKMQDLITFMHQEYEKTGGHSRIYNEFIKMVQGHINAFTSFVGDDKNLKNPQQYIRTIFMGFKYLDTFSHILHTEKFANSAQQREAFTNLDESIRNLRIVLTDAITSHAVEFLREWSNNPIYQNQELALAAVKVQNDLSYATLNLDTAGNSGNPIEENASKLIATARLEGKEKTHHRVEQIDEATDALIKASGSKDPTRIMDYMYQRTAKGYKNGQIVSQQGSYYKQLKNEVDSALLHEIDGEYVPKVFHQGSVLTAEQLQWNIGLSYLKEAQRAFNEPEITTGGVWHGNGYSDEVTSTTGRYHQYKKDKVDIEGNLDPNGKSFEEWREQFMYQDPTQYGQWVAKDENNKEYIKWRGENYTFQTWIGAERRFNKVTNKVEPTGYAVEKIGWLPNRNLTTSLQYSNDKEKTLLWDNTYARIMAPNAQGIDKAHGDYYRMYVGQMRELVEGLPAGVIRWFEQGNIPVIEANVLQKMASKDADVAALAIKEVKDWFTIRATYDQSNKNKTGTPNQSLPIMFTGSLQDQAKLSAAKEKIAEHAKTKGDKTGQVLKEWHKRNDELVRLMKIEANKVTADQLHPNLSLGLKAFAGMAENFKALSDIEDTLLALKAQLLKTTYTDSKGNIVEAAKSNTVRLFNHVMDVLYYDDPNRAKSVAEQVVDKLQRLTTTIFIPFNLFGAFNNKFMARLNNRIDAIGNDFFQMRAYNRMIREYNTKHIPGFVATKIQHLGENGIRSNRDKKAGSKYEAMEGKFHMVRHLQVNDGRISFIADFGGYAPYEAGEYEAQSLVGNSILDSIQMRYTGDKGLQDCSVYDAHTWNEQTGKVELIPGYKYLDNKGEVAADQKRAQYLITNRIHETNDRIHGNYAQENKILLERNIAGRMILQFHKWVYPNFKQRYQKGKFDENLGGGMQIEGRWNTAWGFIKALHKYGMEPMERWNELTEHQRSNVKKDLADIAYVCGLFAFAFIVKKMSEGVGDDDPYVKRMKNWLLYQSDRGLQEVSVFIPGFGLYESYQLVNNPFAATAAIKDFALLLHDMIQYPFVDDEHRYIQKGNRKGESHVYSHAVKALPAINTIDKWVNTMYSTNSFYLGNTK